MVHLSKLPANTLYPAPKARGASGTIHVLLGEYDAFEQTPYLLKKMMDFWRPDGCQISVQQGLKSCPPAADVAILHVDSTVVPEDYLRHLRGYRHVVNGRVTDISKRRISANRVHRADGYAGAVIVKTDRNHGGHVEAAMIRKKGGIGRLFHQGRSKLPWSCQAEGMDYRIFPSPRAVPSLVWWNRSLIVERFLPERCGELYCLRTWVFMGDQESNSISYSKEPIVKAGNVLRRETVPEVPPELRRIREKLGFDFGKFDYAIVNGKVVLYDANRTPTIGQLTEDFLGRIEMLSRGIRCYLT